MNTRRKEDFYGRYMGIEELKQYIAVGTSTAIKIGKDAGAAFKLGRRTLYDRVKIDAYMEAQLKRTMGV